MRGCPASCSLLAQLPAAQALGRGDRVEDLPGGGVLVTRATGRPAVRGCRSAATAPGRGCQDTVSTPIDVDQYPLCCMR